MGLLLCMFFGVMLGGLFGIPGMLIGGVIGFSLAGTVLGGGSTTSGGSRSHDAGTYGSSAFDDDDISHHNAFDDAAIGTDSSFTDDFETNPANGLPMIGCVDIEGNPYGADLRDFFDTDTDTETDYGFDSSLDDSFGSDGISSHDDW